MKPAHTLLFLLSVGLLLLGLQLLAPEQFTIGGVGFKVFSWQRWAEEKPIEKPATDVQKLLQLEARTEVLAASDSTGILLPRPGFALDSGGNGIEVPEVAFHIDSASGIQFPAGDSTILDPFFASLDSLKARKERLRILHFGDSQIEGDRITGYLRQRFQQQFGGCGPGLLPLAEEEPSRFSVEIETQTSPKRYILYGKPKPGPHNRYSVLHSVFRLQADSNSPEKAISQRFNYRLRRTAYQKATYFEEATLLCQNSGGPLEVQSDWAGPQASTRQFPASDSLKLLSLAKAGKRNSLAFRVESGPENDFYGVCLDCPSGVAIDNIPLRGSSGMELLKISQRFLKEQIRQMNVKLVILQFGVNVVPYESKGYGWYEAAMAKAIQTIKKASPGVQVLVISVSDMAQKVDGRWQSYPNIALVKQAQRNAAQKTNSAYWDLHQVMGGQNAIIAWAGTNPPLAGKDYIHLTPKGAQVVGEFLFQALNKVNTQRKKA